MIQGGNTGQDIKEIASIPENSKKAKPVSF